MKRLGWPTTVFLLTLAAQGPAYAVVAPSTVTGESGITPLDILTYGSVAILLGAWLAVAVAWVVCRIKALPGCRRDDEKREKRTAD